MTTSKTDALEIVDYECPKTGRIEKATIKHTTHAITGGRNMTTKSSCVTHDVTECTGAEICKVKINPHSLGRSGSNIDLSLCPLNTSLKNG